ncbi:MAG: purine-nucleoside phosphorylase [Geminicoccaceae bacterium]
MRDLLEAARAVRDRAYAPYSRFRVGVALRGASGRIHVAANVENASYPQGQCAEASAIGVMVAAGETSIAEVAVVGSGPEPCTPCGGCRQRLNEFAAGSVRVHMAGTEGALLTMTIAELLPRSFGPADLGIAPAAALTAGDVIRARAGAFVPRVGIILGSGLGTLAEAIETVAVIAYADLPGFPQPSVQGHAGRLVLGHLAGVPVACLQGRVHLYEGRPAAEVGRLVAALKDMGCTTLLLTNAAGSLRPDVGPGRLVALTDHINLQGSNPLIGGPRFVDMTEVYDAGLRAALHAAAAATGVVLEDGVYAAVLGPCFETPAEIRAFRVLGADLVGMSTVPEAIAARALDLRVAAISVVTNLAAGLQGSPLTHAETLEQSQRAASDLARLIAAALPELAR